MKLLPSLTALTVMLFANGLQAADANEPAKKEAPAWSAGWKVVKIAIPKTGQIEHAFVELKSPEGRAVTLTAGVLNKAAGVALEKVEWTGSPVHAKVQLRKSNERADLSADASLVSRDDALERRVSQVEIEAKFIELPDAVVRELFPHLEDTDKAANVSMLVDAGFSDRLRTLNQKKGVDLLSAPRVTMNSGQSATIEIIREFRYATDWEAPEHKDKPWTPTAFDTQNVGVTLEAKATVNDDDTLDLHLVPQVVEFLGFVEAGTKKAVGAAKPDPKQSFEKRFDPPAKANAKQSERKSPVFATRKTETGFTLRAGQTVALVLRETEDPKPFVPPYVGKTLVTIVTATLIAPEPPHSEAGPDVPAPPSASDLPVAVPVKGRAGFVTSPYSPKAGYIDVRGFSSGTEIKDPYSGKVFRLP